MSMGTVLDIGQIAAVTVHHGYEARLSDGPPAPSGATSDKWRCERLHYLAPRILPVTCRRRFDSCVLPIDQGASSAGRSAVAETWLRIPPAPPAPERIAGREGGQLIVLKRS
jgi:hypothetical protein